MDPSTAALVVRVIAENFDKYPTSVQRNLLEGVFQLADVCEDELNQRSDGSHYENLKASLSLARFFVSGSLKNGDLAEGFRLAAECFSPATAVPQAILC
jgi:hypothetical protein